MRFLAAGLFLAFAAVPCLAQTRLPNAAPPVRLDSNAEHITTAIEFLYSIKNVVVQKHRGKEHSVYKALALRFAQCSILYSYFTQNSGGKFETAELAEFGNSSAVLNLASGFIYPDAFDNYKRDVSQAKDEIFKMMEAKDQKKTFYLLRNCRDYWDSRNQVNAITELMLPH
jgi:hypothetical protein